MNDKYQKLYQYLSSNGMTDLDMNSFYNEYSSNPNKVKKLYSYLSQNGLTDLDEGSFSNEYFAVKKKEVSQSTPKQKVTSSVTSKTAQKQPSVSSGESYNWNGQDYVYRNNKWEETALFEGNKSVPQNQKSAFKKVTDRNKIKQLNYQFKKDVSLDPIDQVYSNYDEEKKDNEYRVSNGTWQRKVPGATSWTTITNEGSVSALNRRYNQNVKYTPEVKIKKPEPKLKFADVNTSLVAKTEEDAVGTLSKKYGKYGFTFEQTGRGTDYVTVYNKDKSKEITVGFDEKNPEEALKLKNFLEQNASSTISSNYEKIQNKKESEKDYYKYISSDEYKNDFKSLSYDEMEKEIDNRLGFISRTGDPSKRKERIDALYDSNAYKIFKEKKKEEFGARDQRIDLLYTELQTAKASGNKNAIKDINSKITAYLNQDVIQDQVKNYSIQLNDLDNSAKKLASDQKKYLQSVEEFNSRAKSGQMTQEEFDQKKKMLDDQAEALSTRADFLMSSGKSIQTNQKKLNVVAGKYVSEKEKAGGFIGGTINSFLGGVGKLIEDFNPKKYIIELDSYKDYKYNRLSPEEKQLYKDKGYSEDQIKNKLTNDKLKEIKKEIKGALIEGIGSDLTTEEYMKSKDRGFFEKAIYGVAESVPAMLMGVGGSNAAFIGLSQQAYSSIEDEMINDPDFETTSAQERAVVAVPYATLMGVLENYGLKNVVKGQSFSGGVVKNILASSIKKMPKGASREVLQSIMDKEVKNLIAKGSLRIINGAIAEFETGATQSLVLDIGLKSLYNKLSQSGMTEEEVSNLSGGEMFATPDSAGEIASTVLEDGLAEAVGGATIGTFTTVASGLMNGNISLYNEEDLDYLREISQDSNFKKIIVANLKTEMLKGNLTKSEAQERLDSMNELSSVIESIPDGLTKEDQIDAVNMLSEKNRLTREIQGKDPALVTAQTERINEINEELKTISKNAIQVETTGEVSVQPEAIVSREVEEGKPQAESQDFTEKSKAIQEVINRRRELLSSEEQQKLDADPIEYAKKSIKESIDYYESMDEINAIQEEILQDYKDDYNTLTAEEAVETEEDIKAKEIMPQLANAERTMIQLGRSTNPNNTDEVTYTDLSDVSVKDDFTPFYKSITDYLRKNNEVTIYDKANNKTYKFSLDGNNLVSTKVPNGTMQEAAPQVQEEVSINTEEDVKGILPQLANAERTMIQLGKSTNPNNTNEVTYTDLSDVSVKDDFTPFYKSIADYLKRNDSVTVYDKANNKTYNFKLDGNTLVSTLVPNVKAEATQVEAQPTAESTEIDDEVRKLEDLLKREDPNFQLDSEITQEEKKEELVSKAIEKMSESDINDISEEAFDAEFPAPDVKTYPIEVKENSELANKLKRMGLKDLIGKKINLVMADQLKVGEVMGKKRMGGPFFPLIDKLFGKVAWASINKGAAKSIVNGAIKSDYTIVYNMNPTAIDSNAAITETFEDLMQSLPKNKQKAIFSAIQEQVLKNKYATKTDQVRAIAKSSKTLSEFFTELDKLDVDTISAVVKNIMPSRDVDAGTKIGKLLQNEGITIESIREMNVEQFASKLPAGALTMVLEVTDKAGNKVTEKTADEAIITPEQQDEEGLPKHNNYPIYVRGRAVAMLNETVPFWNILKESINNINVKIAGIVREKSGRRLTAREAVSNEMRSASMTANVAKKAIEKTNTQYNRFLSTIARSFPNVEVVATQEEFDELLKDLNTKKLSTKNAKVYGAVYKGKLYLNPSLENYNTPIHEFGHVWINTAKVASKQLYSKGVSLVKGTEYENNVRENKEYQRVIKQMKADGASDVDIDNYIYEEALATAIGDKGESFVTASQRLDFKNWMRKLFSFVKSMTGISKYNAEQLEDITLDEFVQAVSIDIMSGTELFKGIKTNISDALQLMTNGSNSIEYIMSVARDNGISDAAIKKYLSNQGFSEQEIKDAFKAQPKAPSTAKVLGKPKAKKVSVNEMSALKNQIRLEAKAAREAKADLNSKRKMLAAAISGMVKTGKIKASQAAVLVKRVSNLNLDNPVMVERFTNYAERVFQRADYQQRLDDAFALRKSIRKLLKTDNQAEVVGMAKAFTKIDPSLVDDIDAYMEMAEKVKNAVKPSRVKGIDVVMKEAANIAEISEYTNQEIARQEDIQMQELLAIHDYLEDISKDMSLKEIQDIINLLKEKPNEIVDKEAKVKEFLKNRFDFMAGVIETMFKTGVDPMTSEEITFDEKQKDLMKRVLNIDLNEMSTREAIKIVEGVDNFINNQITSGLESAVNSYEGAVNVKSLVNRGKVSRPLRLFGAKWFGRFYSEQLFSLPNLMEKMFGGVTNSIDIMRKMGLLNVINGVNKANRQHSDIIDDFAKQDFAKGKDFMDAENIYEVGMLAELKRNLVGNKAEMQAEFNRRVEMLKDSIDLLIEEGNDKEKKMGELYKKVYDKLNVESMDMDVINVNASKNNLEAVNWWINEWSKHRSELFDVSLSVYNTMLTADLNYTPDVLKTLSDKDTGLDENLVNQNGAFAVSLNNIDKNKSGVLMETVRQRPSNRYISLDFYNNNSKALKAALTDINTAAAIRQVDGFLSSKAFNKLVPEARDRALLQRRISTYIKRAKGKNTVPRDTIEYLNKFVNFVTALGVGKALAGFNQTIMQTAPVILNTLSNAGRFDFVDADFNTWLNESGMPISNRGLESQSTIDSIDKKLDAKGQTTEQILKGVAKVNQWWLRQLLVKPDVWVARSSFKSYYLQNLKRRGISTDIDWKNHKIDKEAAEYAQIMVDRQQNISDPMLAGEFLASEDPMRQIARKIFIPFASFILNQKARMYNDMMTVVSKTASREDRFIAARSMFGLAAELTAYQMIGFGIRRFYDMIAASLLGDEDDEETKRKKLINATKYPLKSIVNDIVSPVPLSDDLVTIGLNEVLAQYPWMSDKEIKDAVKERNRILELKGDYPMDAKAEEEYINKIKEEALYQVYLDDNERKYGMIGIAGETYKEVAEISKLYATGEFIDEYKGRETKKKLLEADRKDVGIAVLPMIFYSTGLLTKDVGSIGRNYIKRIKKKAITEKQYERYDNVQKDLGRNLKSWEIELVKAKKESETAISEIEFIERNGGLTESQGREYLKVMKAIGEPSVSDIVKIKEGQTANQILK